MTRYSSLESFHSIEKLLTDFFRVELDALLHNRFLFLLSVLLLLLFPLLLIFIAGALVVLPLVSIGLGILGLLGLLFFLFLGVDLTHVLGQVLHELCPRAMRVIQHVLGTARTALRHQPLLLDVHGRLGVLAFRAQ